MPAPSTTTTYDRVVVAGGSIGGLLAAAALAPISRHVVVLDRDHLDGDPATRPGTPQAAASHGLLASGRLAVEQLLPGFTDELLAGGAISRGDMGRNGRWWIGGGLIADATVGAQGVAVSRALVERTIRRMVSALDRVEIRDATDVLGLVTDGRGGAVTGVRCRPRGSETAAPEVLAADLVVDATGRASRGSRWLTEQGWAEPPLERIRVGVRYATTHVVRREGDLEGRYVCVSAATPDTPRVGVAIAQEDGTWTVSLAGYAEDPPPLDADGFRRYAAGVVSPDLAGLLADRDLLQPVVAHRFADGRRRRWDKVRLPRGYVPIGDAIASFNPTFGQGMSVTALEAVLLRDLAAAGPDALRRTYPGRAIAISERAWSIVVGADLQIAGVDGVAPPGHALVSRYVARVQRVAREDPAVARAFMRVVNLLDPPPALLRPAVLARVLRPHRPARETSRQPVPA